MQRDAATTYYSDSARPSHMGIAVFYMEKPEEHIRAELERLHSTLLQADRYQKYREKQPVLTPAEVMERDAADKKERERREAENPTQSLKDGTVWPDFLEQAFWKALVQWPPMGRKKYIFEGALKGRNELIQDSIYRDTGITRDRKQISSHLQVLKAHLKDHPMALAYMGLMEESPKRHRRSVIYQPGSSQHLQSLQSMRSMILTTTSDCTTSPQTQPCLGGAHTGSALDASSYTMDPSYGGLTSQERFATTLSPGILAPVEPNLDQFNVSAPMVGVEYAQRRTLFSPKPNTSSKAYNGEFDFVSGSDNTLDDGSELTSDVQAYEAFAGQDANTVDFQTLPNFDYQVWADGGVTTDGEGHIIPMAANYNVNSPEHVACYSRRPNPQHTNLVIRLENVVEQCQTCMGNENFGQIPQSQAITHDDGRYEQASQCEDLVRRSIFGIQKNDNHSIWDSEEAYQRF